MVNLCKELVIAKMKYSKMTPREAVSRAKKMLRKKFNQPFIENKEVRIGPNKWQLDLVSKDGQIVAEVKTRQAQPPTDQQFITLFKRGYIFDCLKLEKVTATKRYFFLASDKKLFDRFEKKAKGLIKKVKMVHLTASCQL